MERKSRNRVRILKPAIGIITAMNMGHKDSCCGSRK